MKIIICGAGRIGRSIIAALTREGHEITVLDTNAGTVAGITERYDVLGLCESGISTQALSRAGVSSAGLFIAATGSDETNLLSCYIAKRMGASHTAARMSEASDAEFMKRELAIDLLIDPELLSARSICSSLRFPSSVRSESFTRGHFEMAELTVRNDSILSGAVLRCLRERLGVPFLVCCVQRNERVIIPDGGFTLREGDRIGLLAAPSELKKVLRYIGLLQKRPKSVLISGGSRTAVYAARMLIKNGQAVKLIEGSSDRCEELCSLLPASVQIICGDGTRHTLLDEEGLERSDAFVSLLEGDEENLLAAYHALDRGVAKIITKVDREGFAELGGKLGLDCLVSERQIAADHVTQYARALHNSQGSRIETLYRLMNGGAEALEFAVSSDFKRPNEPLKDLHIKPGNLIAGILRGSDAIIPTGSDVILPDDRVIVLSSRQHICELEDILP